MNLKISLNAEQSDALSGVVSDYNKNSGKDEVTSEQYLEAGLLAQIESYTKAAFDTSVKRLADAAESLPYEQRLAVIAAVESQLTPK